MARLEPARSCAPPRFGKEGAELQGRAGPLRSLRGGRGASQAVPLALDGPRTRGPSRPNPTILQTRLPELGRSSLRCLALSAKAGENLGPRARGSAGRNRWERPRTGVRRRPAAAPGPGTLGRVSWSSSGAAPPPQALAGPPASLVLGLELAALSHLTPVTWLKDGLGAG